MAGHDANLRGRLPGRGRGPENVYSYLFAHSGYLSQHSLIEGQIRLSPLAIWFRVVGVMLLRIDHTVVFNKSKRMEFLPNIL